MSAQENIKTSISFDFIEDSNRDKSLKGEDFATYPELQRWALFQGLFLYPNHPLGGLLSSSCRMIPASGLSFIVEVDESDHRKFFLYLDLTTYESRQNTKYPTRTMHILVNGKHRKTVRYVSGVTEKNPVQLEIDRREVKDGRLYIKLQPDVEEGGRFWGVWDVFYSYEKEKY